MHIIAANTFPSLIIIAAPLPVYHRNLPRRPLAGAALIVLRWIRGRGIPVGVQPERELAAAHVSS